jgi:hypothetical protein
MSRVYSARVRGGVIVPEGVTPAELAELDDAIAEADRSESVPSAVVLAELARITRATKP